MSEEEKIANEIFKEIEEKNKKVEISKIIFDQYKNIPIEKLAKLIKQFLEILKLLNDLYKK